MLNRAVMGIFRWKIEVKSSKSFCRGNFLFVPFNPLFYVWTMRQCFKNIPAKFQSRQTFLAGFFSKRVTDDDDRRKTFFLASCGEYSSLIYRVVTMEYRTSDRGTCVHFQWVRTPRAFVFLQLSSSKFLDFSLCFHSDSLDTLLYARFDHSEPRVLWMETKKILDWHLPVIPQPRFLHHGFRQPLALCMRKKKRQKAFPSLSLSPFKNLQFHWRIYNSIGSMYPYERGSVSTVVCHLFVVRVPERSAVCSQALCVVSGEASANFERPSRSHFFLHSRQQAIVV